MSDEIEQSESGSPIYRHKTKTQRGFAPPVSSADNCEAISRHVERHIGKVKTVLHEIVSDLVHVDVLLVEPSEERDHWTLITSGMSDLPMLTPPEVHELRFAELMVHLPRSWPIMSKSGELNAGLKDDEYYWPIRWLKMLARFPHEYDTWLGFGHTVPNGDPPEPMANNTKFCAMVLLPSVAVPEEFWRLELDPQRTIQFFNTVPLYREELEFKLKHGVDALLDRFDRKDIGGALDIKRPNVCRRFLGLF